MSDRTKLLKKAVLTSVGASSNVERVKDALKEAMQDLVKVGQELIDDLEEKGKIKTESAQSFLKGLSEEAAKRTGTIEKKVSGKFQKKVKDAAREFGFVSLDQYEEVVERLKALENHLGITPVVKSACEDAVECDVEAESGCETEAEAEGGKKKKGKRQD
ncbi:MAG: hypothetical protein SFV17_00505 [Candidatus Obscuribacter sp.]|nr:hypothetical protein [Candidatus Melainabacteria bacterium]MDX1985144.1 hypothetical protein [Candidatus Obscuribacter sp.]